MNRSIFKIACFSSFAIFLASGAIAQEQLGSTATLEQLRSKAPPINDEARPAIAVISLPKIPVAQARPADAASMRLQLGPNYLRLKPGSGQLYFARAIIDMMSQPAEVKKQLGEFLQIDFNVEIPTEDELSRFLAAYASVIDQLKKMADCEDLVWDLRLRDYPTGEQYSAMLYEVQPARSLARVLNLDILRQLQRGDFESAMESIRAGFRVAHLVRTGETLVHQMTAVAIEGMMDECVRRAITTSGCPNLYFAVASLPDQRENLIRAIQMEQRFGLNTLPAIAHAENGIWSKELGQQFWRESVATLQENSGSSQNATGMLFWIQTVTTANSNEFRDQLVNDGYPRDKLEKMTWEQIGAITVRRELVRHYQTFNAACLLEYPAARNLIAEEERKFKEAKSRRELGTILSDLLLPAVQQVHESHLRSKARRELLLTVEAVRDFVASHNGRLPQSLDELKRLPPGIDPFTGQPVSYSITEENGAQVATFSLNIGEHYPLTIRQFKLIIQP